MQIDTGDRVRLEVEGVVIGLMPEFDSVVFVDATGTQFMSMAKYLAVVEPDEDLQPGDVVQDSQGFLYSRRSDGSWEEFGNGDVLPDHEAVRPLTLLLRDGQLAS